MSLGLDIPCSQAFQVCCLQVYVISLCHDQPAQCLLKPFRLTLQELFSHSRWTKMTPEDKHMWPLLLETLHAVVLGFALGLSHKKAV